MRTYTIDDRCDKLIDGKPFRKCSQCANFKQLGCYSMAAQCKNGIRKTCKTCSNKTKATSVAKRSARNPHQRETLRLRYKYGMTFQEYQTMFDLQNGVCAICKEPETTQGKNLSVDHCHATGKIRGLLCHRCNAGIGMLKDNVDIMLSSIAYLKRSKGE
jgi:hypothetical protein